MSSQFKNAFIRQMGREFAHSAYQAMQSYGSDLSSVDEKTFTTKLVSINYVWLGIAAFVALFFPYIMIVPFITGIIRLVSPNITGHYWGVYSEYKADRRYRGGKQYLGKTETWVKSKKSISECTEEQVKDARMAGLIEVAISIIMFLVGVMVLGELLAA